MGSDIAAVAIAGVWWRQLAHGRAPLARPDPRRDARWQRGEVADALYLAESPQTAWAEWYRWLAEYGLPPAAGLPRDLWRVEVDLSQVADLRSADQLAQLGLSAPRPDTREWPSFQEAGERLAGEGYPALIAPSAARSGGEVLCVFWPPREGSAITTAGQPDVVREPPVPPRGLRT